MPTVKQCCAAIDDLAVKLAKVRAQGTVAPVPDRTLALRLVDLDTVVRATLVGSTLTRTGVEPVAGTGGTSADVTVSCSSEVLLRLCAGEVSFPVAWATGKLSVDASLRDVLRLRSLL